MYIDFQSRLFVYTFNSTFDRVHSNTTWFFKNVRIIFNCGYNNFACQIPVVITNANVTQLRIWPKDVFAYPINGNVLNDSRGVDNKFNIIIIIMAILCYMTPIFLRNNNSKEEAPLILQKILIKWIMNDIYTVW